MSQREILDRYFIEYRGKLLDLAAFLDRLDRAPADGDDANDDDGDFRLAALRRALDLLTDGDPDRTRRVLELLSDPTAEPLDRATPGPATGAYASPDP